MPLGVDLWAGRARSTLLFPGTVSVRLERHCKGVTFKAIADPQRLRMLATLARAEDEVLRL
jgi:hypothetical protein